MSTFERRRCPYCRYHGFGMWPTCPYNRCASHLDLRLAYPVLADGTAIDGVSAGQNRLKPSQRKLSACDMSAMRLIGAVVRRGMELPGTLFPRWGGSSRWPKTPTARLHSMQGRTNAWAGLGECAVELARAALREEHQR